MLVAFFFKSLFLLASIEFKTIFKHFCSPLCIATDRKEGHWIKVGQTFLSAITLCLKESPKKYYTYQPFWFNSVTI